MSGQVQCRICPEKFENVETFLEHLEIHMIENQDDENQSKQQSDYQSVVNKSENEEKNQTEPMPNLSTTDSVKGGRQLLFGEMDSLESFYVNSLLYGIKIKYNLLHF